MPSDTGRRTSPSRRLLVSATVLLGVVLAGCNPASEVPQNSLDPAGPIAEKINNLFWPVFWIAVAVFVLVQGALLFAVWKFRQRDGVDHPVKQIHGNTRLEIMWTIAPAVILAVIAVPTVQTIFEIAERPDPSTNPLEVIVTGHQWWWEFEYPEYGFTTANEMWIPVDRPVDLHLTSDDVIHSFWVPRLNGKRDAVPGRANYLTLHASEPGWYLGQCAEFCGLAHADMRQRVNAVSEAEFEAWAQGQAQPAVIPTDGLGAEGWETFQLVCTACHAVDGTAAQAQFGPNLTHYASRTTFGGASFENTTEHLRAWLRDPSDLKPMTPELNDLERGRILGMPTFGLDERQIDGLVALLESWE